jgi:hypothetical protein
MRHRLPKIGPPLAEVVVDVNGLQACCGRPALEGRQALGHGLGLGYESFGAWEGQIVDDVNEQQGRSGDRYSDGSFAAAHGQR